MCLNLLPCGFLDALVLVVVTTLLTPKPTLTQLPSALKLQAGLKLEALPLIDRRMRRAMNFKQVLFCMVVGKCCWGERDIGGDDLFFRQFVGYLVLFMYCLCIV